MGYLVGSMQTFETTYAIDVPSTYVHEHAGQGKPLLLFAHGFADSAKSILKRALPDLDPRFEILAPNGPFPMPQRVGNEWKDAFAWYFARNVSKPGALALASPPSRSRAGRPWLGPARAWASC